MLNLACSLVAGLAGFLLFRLLGFRAWSSIFPGALFFVACWFALNVWISRRVQAAMEQVQKEAAARHIDRAVALLTGMFSLARWQFLLAGQLHAHIGSLLYMTKRFDEAEPHLKKSFFKVWHARAMLAALHYRRKQWAEMEEVFETTLKANKKEGLLYAVYAWCEDKRGERKKAIGILEQGVKAVPGDEKLQTSLTRLQNDKRLKLEAYGQVWWQFLLEEPLMMQQQNQRISSRQFRWR